MQSLVSKSKHVPFRNSKLTYLLQDSLGGESKALMLVCASPCCTDAAETSCSLNFASRVRNVELGPATKRKGSADALAEMKIKDKERELESLRNDHKTAQANSAQLQARVAQLEFALKDSQQLASCSTESATVVAEGSWVEAGAGEPSELAALVAVRDEEIAALRAQLAAGGAGEADAGDDSLNASSSSSRSVSSHRLSVQGPRLGGSPSGSPCGLGTLRHKQKGVCTGAGACLRAAT